MSRVRELLKPAALVLTVGALAAALVSTPREAEANTAANVKIRNTVTVNYKDLASAAQTAITATVDIQVTLVAATPTLNIPTDISTTPNVNAVYNYTLTTNANGPDSYNLTKAVLTQSAGISGSTDAFSLTPITLGATTVATAGSIAAAGPTVISVPSDLLSDATVNGIVGTGVATVVINGQLFTVASVVDNGNATPTVPPTLSTITVTGNGTLTAIAIGDLIREQKGFTYTVTPGTLLGTVNQTIDATISARDIGNVQAAASDATVTTVTVPQLTVTKYVANTTAAVVGGGSTLVKDTGDGAGSITYYTTSVTGKPGDTLEYVVQISNAGGGSAAKNVVISDPLNMFVTYVAGKMRIDPGTGTFAALLDPHATPDAGEFDTTGKIVYIYAGTGGLDNGAGPFGTGAGGDLAAGATTYGVYRVTIN